MSIKDINGVDVPSNLTALYERAEGECLCLVVFKGPDCRYSGSAIWCNKTRQRCVALGNEHNYRGWIAT